jgi:signal transduction histidine kinase
MSEVVEGSRVLLICTARGETDSVLVTVSDTGPGLPEGLRLIPKFGSCS